MTRSAFVFLPLLLACNGDGKDNTDGPSTGPNGPPSYDFKQQVNAKLFDAEINPATVEAHQVTNMLLAATGVVVSDEKVQDRLNTNGGGGYRAVLECWTRPEFPMFSFAMDYTGCGGYQMSGGAFINDHPSGPLLFEFNAFTIQERELGGTFALDTRDAFPDPLYWQAYDTDSDSPGTDNRVQLGIKLAGVPKGLTYDGGASVDFLSQEWSMWGVATLSGDTPITVVHGGEDPSDVAPDDPPGADSMKKSLNWLECRCPTSGISAYDMPLDIETVTIDIDDLEMDPDEFDDVDLVIPVQTQVVGRAVLDTIGCGEYEVEYTSDAATITVSVDQLLGQISFKCDTLAIDDQARCDALIEAAVDLGESFEVEITQEDLNATARIAVESEFDTTWCRLY